MQVLRATAKLSTTIFYIPLVSSVMHLFNCVPGDVWDVEDTWQCYSGVHLVMSIISIVVILCFSLFAFIGECSHYDGFAE